MGVKTAIFLSFAFLITVVFTAATGCGGPKEAPVQTGPSKVEQSQIAITTVRTSFEKMGGIQRFNLAGSKAGITATVTANGNTFPVEITLGGPGRYRINLVNEQISYIYDNETCRKIVFGILAHCTPDEAAWNTPLKILTGLTFPAGDAANLDSAFRLKPDITVNGNNCTVAEIRPKNSNLKFRSAFDKNTGLLAQSSFYFKDNSDNKTNWQVNYSDWREANKMMVPFSKTISVNGAVIWQQTIETIDFDGCDERAFLAPLPPTNDSPLPAVYPDRKIIRTNLHSVDVEIPAPSSTIGSGGCFSFQPGTIEEVPSSDVVHIIHKGPVSKAPWFFDKLKIGADAANAKIVGNPGIIVLEHAQNPDDAVLMLIYVKIQK